MCGTPEYLPPEARGQNWLLTKAKGPVALCRGLSKAVLCLRVGLVGAMWGHCHRCFLTVRPLEVVLRCADLRNVGGATSIPRSQREQARDVQGVTKKANNGGQISELRFKAVPNDHGRTLPLRACPEPSLLAGRLPVPCRSAFAAVPRSTPRRRRRSFGSS